MKRVIAVSLAVLALALAAFAQTYPSEGFRATFPSTVTSTKQNITTKVGDVELRAYTAQTSDGTAFFVGVCDYTPADIAGWKGDINAELQGAKNGALENTKSHLTREKTITLQGYHGLEFESETDTLHFYARIYATDNGTTFYQTVVVYPINTPPNAAMTFLDSFELIPRTR